MRKARIGRARRRGGSCGLDAGRVAAGRSRAGGRRGADAFRRIILCFEKKEDLEESLVVF